MAKNRRLLDELTRLRVSWEDLSGQHAKSEDIIESLKSEVARQKSLNERLENDLMAVNKGLDGEVGKGAGTATPAQGLAGLDIGGKIVRCSWSYDEIELTVGRMAEHHRRLSQRMAIPPSYLLLPASVTASVSAMLNWRR